MKKTITCFLAMSWLLVARGQEARGLQRDPEKPNKTQRVQIIKSDGRSPESTMNQILHPDKNQEFKKVKSKQSKSLGLVTDVYELYYKGVRVDGSELRVINQNGKPKYVLHDNDMVVSDMNVKPRISSEQAMSKMLSKHGARKYAWQDPGREGALKQKKHDPNATYYPKAELVILPEDGRLAYKFEVLALEPFSNEEIWVDAQSGDILKKADLMTSEYHPITKPSPVIPASTANNTALQMAEVWVKVYTEEFATFGAFDPSTGLFSLNNIASNIHTLRTDGVTNQKTPNQPISEFSTNQTVGAGVGDFRANEDYDEWVATRVHLGLNNAYSYYLDKFNRLGFDGSNSEIKAYIYPEVFGSSFYDREQTLFFPYDSGVDDDIVVAPGLQTTYHEYAHAFTMSESGLIGGTGESGNLNEGLSDIWSYIIQDDFFNKHPNIGGNFDPELVKAMFKNDWRTGAGNTAFQDFFKTQKGYSVIRDAKDPKSLEYPAFYGGKYWNSHISDGHFNSTVISHWYFLLSEGQSVALENNPAETLNVQGIGIQEAAKIIYLATTNFLGKYSDFKSFALQTTLAAKILFGENSGQAKSVQDAWKAVGLGELDFSSDLACTPPADYTSDFYVRDFRLINIQNTKPLKFNGNYQDYTYLKIDAEKGQSYDIYLRAQGKNPIPGKLYWSIWIDADSSKTFEPSEKVFSDQSTTSELGDGIPGAIYKGTITMPMKTAKDSVYLRLVLSAEPDASPCYEKLGKTPKYIEDYSILLSTTCSTPHDHTLSDFKDAAKGFQGLYLDTIKLVECGGNQIFKITPPSNLNYIDMTPYTLTKGKSYSLMYNFKETTGLVDLTPHDENNPNKFLSTCATEQPIGFNVYDNDPPGGPKDKNYAGGSHELHSDFLIDEMLNPSRFNSVVWIDFNRNGLFEESEGFGSKWDDDQKVFYTNFLVPDWALVQPGVATIRITAILANTVFGMADACGKVMFQLDNKWTGPIILSKNGLDIDMTIQKSNNMFLMSEAAEKQEAPAPSSAEASLDPVSLNLYPNPATDLVDLSIKGTSADNFTLELYNSEGMRLLIQQPWDGRALDVSKYPNGIYVLTLRRDREIYSQKLIIQR